MANNNEVKLIIAIDFGNEFSGFAYSFLSSDGIYKNSDWKILVGQKDPYIKTPTCLLYEGKKLDSWGYKAKQRLMKLRQNNMAGNYHFFEKFKAKLFHQTQVDEKGEPYLEDNGERFLLTDLVADYLREIRLIALQDVKNHTGGAIDETRIRWCLTVPAIWDDAAKQLMEQAAKKSGILKDGDWDAGRFMFALEPEAASVYCLYVVDKELGIVEDKSTMMIVDCGSGTTDLTVHEIIREGRDKGLREVVPGSGAADGHGGKDVDRNFLNYLAKVLGGGAIDKFESRYPESYVQMMDDWKILKYEFDFAVDYRIFRIPGELRDLLQKQYPKVLEELANKQNGNSFNIWLTRKVVEEEIFGPVVNNILAEIEERFHRIGGKCDYLFLIGDFAPSRFLQQRVKDKFSNQVRKKILIPEEPGKFIMMGAVQFARTPFNNHRTERGYRMDSSFSIAIAIDFGTTFSGYAYCFSAHTTEGTIYKNTDWNMLVGQKSSYVKTPTHLLYEGKKFDSWGYKAKQRLVELRQKNAAGNYHFFEKFKTKLLHRTQVDEKGEPYLEDNGERFLLIDLIGV